MRQFILTTPSWLKYVSVFYDTPTHSLQLDPSTWANPDKEGELRKQGMPHYPIQLSYIIGHIVKSWKVRWFVIKKDIMYYFKTKKVGDPIPL